MKANFEIKLKDTLHYGTNNTDYNLNPGCNNRMGVANTVCYDTCSVFPRTRTFHGRKMVQCYN